MGSITANYRFADDRANLNLNVNYTGEQYDFFFDPVTFARSRVPLDSYTVLDLAGSWQISRSKPAESMRCLTFATRRAYSSGGNGLL